MRCGPGCSPRRPFSNDWKTILLLFPILGTFFLPARAGTVDTARARGWLEAQVPALIATSASVRVLAAVALALPAASPARASIEITLQTRQAADGFWTRPGSTGALEDQGFALLAMRDPGAMAGGGRALLSMQRADGGWSPTLGRYDHADAVSTALALAALRAGGLRTADPAHAAAVAFLDGLRDAESGAYGYESRGLGAWGSTAAAIHGRDRIDFDAATAWHSLAEPLLLQRKPRRPLVEALFLAEMSGRLPTVRTANIRTGLRRQIESEQAADGHWPAPGRQREDGDAYATALTLLALERLERAPVPPPMVRPIVLQREGQTLAVLLALPAREAETMLVEVGTFPVRQLAVPCGIESLEGIGAGPLRVAEVPRHARDALRLAPRPLLAASNYIAWASNAVAALTADSAAPAFRAARAAWLDNDPEKLARHLDTLLPRSHRAELAQLRHQARAGLEDRLRTGEACLVVLDAWLACGEDGLLAGLKRDGWRLRE